MAGGVKNFFWERSGAALLFSSLNDAASIAASEVSDADNVTRVPSQASDTILRDTMQIQPVLRINQGAEVGIMVARDFDFSNRSEEHTSELQSLMRNSYDVFCLKKKKNKDMELTQ